MAGGLSSCTGWLVESPTTFSELWGFPIAISEGQRCLRGGLLTNTSFQK